MIHRTLTTTKQSRKLLSGDGATRYSYIYWNLGWSHDSKSIAFKARCRDANLKDELVVIEPDHPEEFKILHSALSGDSVDYFFSPDNDRVILIPEILPNKGTQLHAIDRKKPGAPEFLGVTIPGHVITGSSWSRNGKTIAVTTQESRLPIDWIR